MFWDKISPLYDLFETVYNGRVYSGTGAEVAELINSSDIVLECACGTGAISQCMKQSTNDAKLICDTASALMKELTDRLFDEGEVLRLIGVGVSGLDHGEYRQIGMEDWLQANEQNQLKKKEKKKKLDEMVRKIRAQYGEGAVIFHGDNKGGSGIILPARAGKNLWR